jgi:hypothetical protein
MSNLKTKKMSNLKTKKSQTTDLVVSPQQKLDGMLNAMDAKIQTIKTNTNKPNLTSGLFGFTMGADNKPTKPINIHTEMSVRLLISVLGFLIAKKAEYETAAKTLNLKNYPMFVWCNFDFDAWANDINTRILVLTNHEELKKLEDTRNELSKFQSKDAQMMQLMEMASKML